MESSEGSMEIQGGDHHPDPAASAFVESGQGGDEAAQEPDPEPLLQPGDALEMGKSDHGGGGGDDAPNTLNGVLEEKNFEDIKMEEDSSAEQNGDLETNDHGQEDSMEAKMDDGAESTSLRVDVPLSPAALAASPSLRGNLISGGADGSQIFKGLWALNDEAHKLPGQTGEFEFKLDATDPDSPVFPVNGLYKGFFVMKTGKGGTTKNADELTLRFVPVVKDSVDGEYNIFGTGNNKFGRFTVQGSLSADTSMVIYKIFEPVVITSVPQNLKRKKPESSGGSLSRQSSISSLPPRESTPRVRQEKVKIAAELPPTLPPRSASLQRQSSATSVASEGGAARRPTGLLSKCSDLLKEMMRYPSATWFLEPVDPIKMNIPDYPLIIKDPMDFRTMKEKLEQGAYDTADKFATDMRQVFKNAMTYNHMKDSPVHVAAKDLSVKFEDKFRTLKASPSAASDVSELQAPPKKKAMPSKPVPTKAVAVANTSAAAPSARPKSTSSGPRASSEPVTNAANLQLLEMQRQMAAMQSELTKLRAQVVTSNVSTKPNSTAAVSKATAAATTMPAVLSNQPLEYEEKKLLISQIHALPPQKLAKVIEIIQASLPPGRADDNGEEVEIPIDELDTTTLRKLQEYVENSTKKRAAPGSKIPGATPLARSASMSSTASSGAAAKKQKKENSSVSKSASSTETSAVVPEKMTKSVSADANLGQVSSARPSKSIYNSGFEPHRIYFYLLSSGLGSDSLEFEPFIDGSGQATEDLSMDGDTWTLKRSESNRTDETSGTSDAQAADREASWGVAVTEKQEIENREIERKLQVP